MYVAAIIRKTFLKQYFLCAKGINGLNILTRYFFFKNSSKEKEKNGQRYLHDVANNKVF